MKDRDPAAEKARQETLERNREDLNREGAGRQRRRGMRRERQDRVILERRRLGLPRRWPQATVWSLVIGGGTLAIVWFLA
jgi:hypothetical protein